MESEDKLLDTLMKIQQSLEHIEQSVNSETQKEVIRNSVLQALTGKKSNPVQ